jgi:hypothetical protein
MSESEIVPGQWFYEKVGRTWFVVHAATSSTIHLKEPDTGTSTYLKRYKNEWLPAKMNDDGVFYVVKCRYGAFEFRGDEGPRFSQFSRPYVVKTGVSTTAK